MSWFMQGENPDRDKFIKDAYTSNVIIFGMKKGETKEVVFVDDVRFGLYEHKLQIGGFWKSFTCSGEDCYLCGIEKPRSYSEYYTVLDLTPYVSKKDGKEHKYSRKPL